MVAGKGKIASENYTMLYSYGVNVAKGVVIVLRNYIVKRLTKVECYRD